MVAHGWSSAAVVQELLSLCPLKMPIRFRSPPHSVENSGQFSSEAAT
jgi:hypothetical protein